MLRKDQQVFLDFVSGQNPRIENALLELKARERGHFEDHPMSAKLVKEHLNSLIHLWHENPVDGCREWVSQFIADARVVDSAVKPLVVSSLSDENCKRLPTVLNLMRPRANLFGDIGALLVPLASNPDREVRWRVEYLISRMRALDLGMRQALALLETDKDDTTRVYVEACKGIT